VQLVQVVFAEGDLDRGPVGVPVVLDLEVERLEQMAQDRLGHLGEPLGGGGEGVEQLERVDAGLPVVEGGQLVALLRKLAFEVVELLPDLGEQLALVVLSGGEGRGQALLLGGQVLDGSRERAALAVEVAGGVVGDVLELVGEPLAPVGVEDPLGEEVEDAV